jgi:hypothetical protein
MNKDLSMSPEFTQQCEHTSNISNIFSYVTKNTGITVISSSEVYSKILSLF